MDSRPMWSKFSGIRGPPIAAASKDKKGWEGFLDEIGLKLDKWEVEKQESKHSIWEEKHFFYLFLDIEIDFFSWEKKTFLHNEEIIIPERGNQKTEKHTET